MSTVACGSTRMTSSARQARLADPGVPDDHEPARDVARGDILEERFEARQLRVAADERRVEAARDRVGRRVETQDTEAAALVRHDVDGLAEASSNAG